ncbi:MAG TPA: SDR family NAD(P)-dependent oxidoreductase [Methylomirabilota bacterium]|nr:SDR family NAD(P)-dependent oxidoreductase [Methylomirabilota bacterium]
MREEDGMGTRLQGKVAIVTGAGSRGPGLGNGKATAILFARERARVLCVDQAKERAEETVGLIRAEGGEAQAFAADVTRAADCRAMVEAATGRWAASTSCTTTSASSHAAR